MGIFDFFKKKTEHQSPDPVSGLTLDNLKKGYYVDYDMKTWQVMSANRYDWGNGDLTYEWQIQSFDDILFLEREPDDEDYWCISRKIPFGRLDPSVIKAIKNTDDPPETITFEGSTYYLDETGGALFFKDDNTLGKEVFKWDYTDDTENMNLTIEQWSDTEYEVSLGQRVEEYQFTDILPSESGQ